MKLNTFILFKINEYSSGKKLKLRNAQLKGVLLI